MSRSTLSKANTFRSALLLICLIVSTSAMAQAQRTIASFRAQYDAMMANYAQLYAASGNVEGQMRAQQGRDAMRTLSDDQLGRVFAKTRIPDLSTVTSATSYLVERRTTLKSLPFPGEPSIVNGCVGTDYSSATRYIETIANEVTQSILAAAAWACNEDILGENGSLACVPLAIAADVTAGLIDVANFCAGEVTANQVQANFDRLGHIHDDLSSGISTIVNNDNGNTSSIIANDNTNRTTIINNDNTNRATIVNNDNANTATLITNANANKDAVVAELRALGCEIVRLLNTPDGQKASSILACSAQPGFPYSWNKK